ncbi:MAG TPA: hypothetical protein VIP98_08230 [Microlunatus sp.]
MHEIPPDLIGVPFTIRDAARLGISQRVLAGSRFRRILRGVYLTSDQPVTTQVLARAALLVAPPGSIITGVTALQLYGVEVGSALPIRLASAHPHPVRRSELRVSRVGAVPAAEHRVCQPGPALLDACAELTLLEAVTAGDQLIRERKLRPSLLTSDALELTGRGSRQARRVAGLVREDVDSARETRLRLCLVLAGLPEPSVNRTLRSSDDAGHRDLLYREFKLVLEYEGDHHRVDRRQWDIDIGRNEAAAIDGWLVIRVTNRRISRPRGLVRSVYQRLVERGYLGPPPNFSAEWQRFFES